MGMDAIFGIVKSWLLLMLGEAYSSFLHFCEFFHLEINALTGSNTLQYGTYMHILASIATSVLGVT